MRHVRKYLSELLEAPERSPILSSSDLSSLRKDLGNPNAVLGRYILHLNALGLLLSEHRRKLEEEGGTLEDLLPPDYFRHPFRVNEREEDELRVEAELQNADYEDESISVPLRVPSTMQARSRDRQRQKSVAFEQPRTESSEEAMPPDVSPRSGRLSGLCRSPS